MNTITICDESRVHDFNGATAYIEEAQFELDQNAEFLLQNVKKVLDDRREPTQVLPEAIEPVADCLARSPGAGCNPRRIAHLSIGRLRHTYEPHDHPTWINIVYGLRSLQWQGRVETSQSNQSQAGHSEKIRSSQVQRGRPRLGERTEM